MPQAAKIDRSDDLLSTEFGVDDALIESTLVPHVRKSYDSTDPAWQERASQDISKRTLGRKRWLKRMLLSGRNAAHQKDVRAAYETHWTRAETLEDYVSGLNDRFIAVEWRDHGYEAATQSLRAVHILYMMQAIDVVKPRTVLEVGFGNGNTILTLAARFPNVAFSGVELTEAGVSTARTVQKLGRLPSGIADNSPLPVRDLEAHKRVDLKVGDARSLPFPDQSFDLVYTRLALEQMEQVRQAALKEITRVAGRAVVLVEPWQDYNTSAHAQAYIKRVGYFTGKIADLEKLGFKVVFETEDIPQKIQFRAGPVVAVRNPQNSHT